MGLFFQRRKAVEPGSSLERSEKEQCRPSVFYRPERPANGLSRKPLFCFVPVLRFPAIRRHMVGAGGQQSAAAPSADRTIDMPKWLEPNHCLAKTDPNQFANRPYSCTVSINNQVMEIRLNPKPNSDLEPFAELQKNRKERDSRDDTDLLNQQFLGQGRRVNNAGVSLALQVEINGETYAPLVRQMRPGDKTDTWKLISGYVNDYSSSPESPAMDHRRAALNELSQELLVISSDKKVMLFNDGANTLSPNYNEAAVSGQTVGVEQCPVPVFVNAIGTQQQLKVANEVIANASCYVDKPNDSAQVVFGYKFKLPQGATMVHVEDVFDKGSADKPPSLNATVQQHDALVFAKLTKDGRFSGDYFLMDPTGKLQPFQAWEKTNMSEAFAASKHGYIVEDTVAPVFRAKVE